MGERPGQVLGQIPEGGGSVPRTRGFSAVVTDQFSFEKGPHGRVAGMMREPGR